MASHRLREIERLFKTAPKDYGPIALWAWNAKIEQEEVSRQLELFKEANIAEVMVWPSMGLEIEYLSAEYFEMFEFVCRGASKLNLGVWIFDEYNWPSGTAGGMLLARYPQYRSSYLRLETVGSKLNDRHQTTDSTTPAAKTQGKSARDFRDKGIVAAFWVSESTGAAKHVKDLAQAHRLVASADNGQKLLLFRALNADTLLESSVGNPWSKGLRGYLDVLNPQAVRAFINLTHEAYYKRLGRYFGTVIKGFFTDEPSLLYDFKEGRGSGGSILDGTTWPWTKHFRERFSETTGYDPVPRLFELVVRGGDSTFRSDFWDVASELYASAYHRAIRNWCEGHQVVYMGHLFQEYPLQYQIKYQGNIMKSLQEFTVPGVDIVGRWKGIDKAEYLPAKLAVAAANVSGSKRVLAEALSVTGLDLTLQRIKKIVDFLFATGVNLMLFATYFYSMKGFRKHTVPPTLFYQSPWWPYHKLLTDYIARVSFVLSQGTHSARVALLYPWSSLAGGLYDGHIFDRQASLVAQAVERASRQLLENNIEFDLEFEQPPGESLSAKRHVSHWENYELIVVPWAGYLSDALAKSLEAYSAEGGKIVLFSADPDVKANTGLVGENSVQTVFATESSGRTLADVVRLSLNKQPPDEESVIQIEGGHGAVLSYQRRTGDGSVVFLCNAEPGEAVVNIITSSVAPPRLWNPETGAVELLAPDSGVKDHSTVHCFTVKLEGYASAIVAVGRSLRITNAGERALGIPADAAPCLTVALPDRWSIRLAQPNLLPLCNWEVRQNEKLGSTSSRVKGWIKLKDNVVPSTVCHQSQYRVRTDFVVEEMPPRFLLLFEDGRFTDITVNNEWLMHLCTRSARLDESTSEIDITSRVGLGRNTIEATFCPTIYERDVQTDAFFGNGLPLMVEGVYLAGEFAVSGDKLTRLPGEIEVGSWHDQGLPYYSGSVCYACEFLFDIQRLKVNDMKGLRILLSADVHEGAMEVQLNGVGAGTRPWAPYRVDLSSLIRVGHNQLTIRVTNTMSNMMGTPIPCGLKRASLDVYRCLTTP